MRKTLLYLFLLLLVAVGVYFLLFNKKQNPYGEQEAGFTVKDTSSIGEIYLARPTGESISIKRTSSGWIVNKRYKAHRGTLAAFLRVIKLQEAISPVARASHNTVIKSMAGNSIKVELYDRDGDKLRTFYVGGLSYDYGGNYMVQEHAKKPYIVNIPGFPGVVGPVYTTDIDDWRDRTVFNVSADNIKTLSIKYLGEPLNSFTITQDAKVTVATEPGVVGSNSLNEKRVKTYLGFFENVNCEGYLHDMPELGGIISTMPLVSVFDITGKDGYHQHLEIFRMPLTKRSKNLSTDAYGEYDADRFYATMNDYRDTVIVQSYNFKKLWRKAYEFYQPDEK
jgi:hypothetical protein